MIHFTVREINPLSMYNGQVYTQRVLVELTDGSEVHIEDPGCDIDESMVDSPLSASVVGQSVTDIKSNKEKDMKIEQAEGGGANLFGKVSSIDLDRDYPVTIEIAESTVHVDLKDIENLAVGDWVAISGSTLYIDTISG